MSHDLLKIDFPQIYHAVSISNDIKETVCSLRLPFSSGFDRSQHYDSEVSRVFNKMLQILCEDLNELNINLKTGAQDIENADEGERQKYRFPWPLQTRSYASATNRAVSRRARRRLDLDSRGKKRSGKVYVTHG